MDLVQLLKLLGRQWIIVVVSLLATVAAAVGLSGMVEPEYKAVGSLVLLSSNNPETGDVGVNPWTRIGPSQQVAAQALVTVMGSEAFKRRAENGGITDEFDTLISPTGGGAIIELSVTGKDSNAVLIQLDRLKDALQEELAGLQQRSGAPPSSWFTADVLSFPVEATVLTGSRIRVVAAIAVVGVLVAVTLALVADGQRVHLARRLRRPPVERDLTTVPVTATPPAVVAPPAAARPANGTRIPDLPAPAQEAAGGRPGADEQTEPNFAAARPVASSEAPAPVMSPPAVPLRPVPLDTAPTPTRSGVAHPYAVPRPRPVDGDSDGHDSAEATDHAGRGTPEGPSANQR